MYNYFSCGTTIGLVFLFFNFIAAQPENNSLESDSISTADTVRHNLQSGFWLFRHARVTGGQLTLPFKIRKIHERETFRLTTDVTMGGYVGYTRKLSVQGDYRLTIPLTAGLTFINLNDNNTSAARSETDAAVVPGLTWSTGLILQMDRYNIGLLCGKDYASEVGNDWEYHGKWWWSFAIGFVFLQ